MKTLFITILSLLAFASGCSKEDEVLPKQRETIVNFLKSTHAPKLIPESEIGQSLQRNPPYYSAFGFDVFRYIANVYDEGRDAQPGVYPGSTVAITFRAYVFDGKAITATTMPYYSNDAALEAQYIESGLTPGAWIFEPLTIVLGETQILKGLEEALLGCREGDVVEVYMTYEMAYGDQNFGVVPRQSPVAYLFTVNKVE